eukprot:12907011-Prorocentrum_lima.AAC.1
MGLKNGSPEHCQTSNIHSGFNPSSLPSTISGSIVTPWFDQMKQGFNLINDPGTDLAVGAFWYMYCDHEVLITQ